MKARTILGTAALIAPLPMLFALGVSSCVLKKGPAAPGSPNPTPN